jgi:hypothetical protein
MRPEQPAPGPAPRSLGEQDPCRNASSNKRRSPALVINL